MAIAATNSGNSWHFGPAEIKSRRTRIKVLRSIFLVLSSLSAALFFCSIIISAFSDKRNAAKDILNGDALVIASPRFIGHSSAGGKITITAQSATRTIGNAQGAIRLIAPHMTTEEGADVVAKNGTWNQSTQELRLTDDVIMTYPSGDKANAQSAYWGNNDPNITVQKPENSSIRETLSAAPSKLWLQGQVHFVRPSGDTIDGQNAIWDSSMGRLSLSGGVVVKIKNGTANSQNLLFDTKASIAKGVGGVSIIMPMGNASAQSYDYYRCPLAL